MATPLLLGTCVRVFAFTAIACFTAWVPQSIAQENLQELVIAHEASDAEVIAARESFLALLSPIVPEKSPTATITQDGRYILHGELFGGRKRYALATLDREQPAEGEDASTGVGFAAWSGEKWKIRGLWWIEPVWSQEDPEKKGHFYPIRPAKIPFWLQDLGDDRTPEVVLVGSVHRYFQDHYILKLSSKGTLHLAAHAMGKPALAAGMLRLHFNSGRRAIFGREEFFRWAGDTLVPVAASHEETPYNEPDSPFTRITRYDEKGKGGERWRISFAESKEPVNRYAIYREPLKEDPDGLPASDKGEKPGPSARVTFLWPATPDGMPSHDALAIENRFFWERLSGLPWTALPSDPDAPPVPRLPKGVKVKVNGDPELVRRLSTEFQDRIAPPPVRPSRR